MRNLIVGDIHGCYDELCDVLKQCNYDKKNDNLYFTGDMSDRGLDNVKVIRYLMKLKNYYPVFGNHDVWLQNFLLSSDNPTVWRVYNGGIKTLLDFAKKEVPKEEKQQMGEWVREIPLVRITDNYVVLHGGIPKGMTMEFLTEASKLKRQPNETLKYESDGKVVDYGDFVWNRGYLVSALKAQKVKSGRENYEFAVLGNVDEFEPQDIGGRLMFMGHTPLTDPFYSEKYHLVALDTGSCFDGGHITVVDMDTLDYWQSGKKESGNLKEKAKTEHVTLFS